MSYRFMRVVVFFDLPTLSPQDRRAYTRFRKKLIRGGFIMVQESVYSKLVLNQTAAAMVMEHVRKEGPEKGLVQMLVLTEKQYNRMEYIVGEHSSEVIDTDERLVIL